ncbi:DUF2510 domain-containing protein [Paenarthrobacter nicotinovorans]|uniref:DUF2510 domain-containing protein n=1 Tax=Paenarthrobacter nicotinovorans TaxID=29320 RepID=UPI0027D8911E|nr:DUF2510 domain-containing protein [Paenarthrobacter nicotinovorans]
MGLLRWILQSYDGPITGDEAGIGLSGCINLAEPAGWYPDPNVPDQQRWWDGREWTPHVRYLPTPSTHHDIPGPRPSATTTRPGFFGRLGPSTYIATGLLGLLMIPFAAVGGLLVWLALAIIVVFLTGLYTLLTGRRSWANIASRGMGALVAGVSAVGFFASLVAVAATVPPGVKDAATTEPPSAAAPAIAEPTQPSPASPTHSSPAPAPTSQSPSPSPSPQTTTAIPTLSPTASPVATSPQAQPTANTPSAQPTRDPAVYAAKYTRAVLAGIKANSFAETCGRSRAAGGHAWACVIDHLESPDDQTIEIHLRSDDDFMRESRGDSIYDSLATVVVKSPNLNTCVYHVAVVAPDGRRVDWYYTYICSKKHDSLVDD